MNKGCYFSRFSSGNRTKVSVFALVYAVGLLAGIFAAEMQEVAMLISIPALLSKPSPILLLLIMAIPVTVFSVVLKLRIQLLLYLFAFVWALCRGFCGFSLYMTIGEGAWLVRCLLLFSTSAASVFVFWLVLRHCEMVKPSFVRDIYFVSFLSLIILALDILLISPFLSQLSMYF